MLGQRTGMELVKEETGEAMIAKVLDKDGDSKYTPEWSDEFTGRMKDLIGKQWEFSPKEGCPGWYVAKGLPDQNEEDFFNFHESWLEFEKREEYELEDLRVRTTIEWPDGSRTSKVVNWSDREAVRGWARVARAALVSGGITFCKKEEN